MKLGDLFESFRDNAGDASEPHFWTDAYLTRVANEAQQQAARRARLITDSSTTGVCQYALTAGQTIVTLDPRVLWVKRVHVASTTRRISRVHARDLDEHRPGWEDSDPGQVLVYVPDWRTGALRLYGSSAADDTLNLTVIRLPLVDLAAEEDTPEIRAEWHPSLVDWMEWKAYSREDSESFDPDRAKRALARFTQVFGDESSAKDEEYMRSEYDFGGFDGVY